MFSAFFNRKALKLIKERRKNMIKYMEDCEKQMQRFGFDAERVEYQQFYRMYWDYWSREEELALLEKTLRGE